MLTHPTHDRLLAADQIGGLTGIAKALEEQRRSNELPTFPWNGCPRCRGTSAHDRVEQMPIFRGMRNIAHSLSGTAPNIQRGAGVPSGMTFVRRPPAPRKRQGTGRRNGGAVAVQRKTFSFDDRQTELLISTVFWHAACKGIA